MLLFKKYDLADIQKQVINLLQNNNFMSSTEISRKMGTNRITISRYLDILYFQKVINKKKIGSVNFWFLEPGIMNFDSIDDDYRELQQKLILSVLNEKIEISENILLSLINKKVDLKRTITEICFPVLNTVLELYDRGKIGKLEKIYLFTNLNELFYLLRNLDIPITDRDHMDKKVLIISGDDESTPLCTILNIYLKKKGIDSTTIGNIEKYIDPFFDIDFQRYLKKIDKKKKIYLCIISFNERSIKFLYSTFIESDLGEKVTLLVFSNENIKRNTERNIQEKITTNLSLFLTMI